MEGRERSALVVSGGALLLALGFSFLVIRQSWRMHFGGIGAKGRVLGSGQDSTANRNTNTALEPYGRAIHRCLGEP